MAGVAHADFILRIDLAPLSDLRQATAASAYAFLLGTLSAGRSGA
ncbi:MAG: hypothetical protein QOJ54_2027, partial [Aliidongia sp.]|nr:hypothetical protein [Aliidongia sp.]